VGQGRQVLRRESGLTSAIHNSVTRISPHQCKGAGRRGGRHGGRRLRVGPRSGCPAFGIRWPMATEPTKRGSANAAHVHSELRPGRFRRLACVRVLLGCDGDGLGVLQSVGEAPGLRGSFTKHANCVLNHFGLHAIFDVPGLFLRMPSGVLCVFGRSGVKGEDDRRMVRLA
jgi:hypothetical protein